jgi:hypothetical protein
MDVEVFSDPCLHSPLDEEGHGSTTRPSQTADRERRQHAQPGLQAALDRGRRRPRLNRWPEIISTFMGNLMRDISSNMHSITTGCDGCHICSFGASSSSDTAPNQCVGICIPASVRRNRLTAEVNRSADVRLKIAKKRALHD